MDKLIQSARSQFAAARVRAVVPASRRRSKQKENYDSFLLLAICVIQLYGYSSFPNKRSLAAKRKARANPSPLEAEMSSHLLEDWDSTLDPLHGEKFSRTVALAVGKSLLFGLV